MLTATLVFLCAFALDFVYALFMRAFTAGQIGRAITYNAGLDVISTAGILLVVDNKWMILPSLAGGALGIGLGMARKKKAPGDSSSGASTADS